MIILINLNSQPFKVEYKDGNKTLVKQLPTRKIVAMKGLIDFSQISNRNFLVNKNITLYNYTTNVYLNRNASTPTGSALSALTLSFIGNDIKPTEITTVNFGYSGATTISGMTFTANNIASNKVFSIITSATTMTNNTQSVSANTSNVVVYFSGASTTTQDIYAALTGSSFSGLGITMTGQGATKISTGSTIQFFVSASTLDINSGYVFLNRLV